MTVGIVGCGGIAQVHAQCVEALKTNRLVAFADVKVERARAMAEKFGGLPFARMEDMIDSARPDVVHICTPHYLHVPMALYAIERGVHVFMEKPPVIDECQYALLRELSLRAGADNARGTGSAVSAGNAGSARGERAAARLGFCFQNRYNPGVALVKEFLESGKAGAIRGARGFVTWSRGEKYYADSDWRGRLATEGGGALINQSIHTLDLLNYLMNRPPLSVDATMANHHLKGVMEVEDTMSACIRYEGAPVCFYATTSYSSDPDPLMEFDCENARVRIEGQRVSYFLKDGTESAVDCPSESCFGKNYWGAGHLRCIGDFYDCITGNRPFPLEFSGVESTIRLMLATYKSARTGQSVAIRS